MSVMPDYDNEAFFDACPVHKVQFYHFGPRTMDDDEEEDEDEGNDGS